MIEKESDILQCKICGGLLENLSSPINDKEFHYCSICDSFSKHESQYPTEEVQREVYAYHENSLDQLDYVDYLVNFVEKAILPFKNGNRLLEFGSGPTPVLSAILEDRYHFEVSIHDKFFAPSKEYKFTKFNVISSTEVIEHISDPMIVFEDWVELLESGGIISIMTLFHPKEKEKFLEWWYVRDRTHLLFYSEKTFEWIATHFNLKILYCDHNRMIVLQKE